MRAPQRGLATIVLALGCGPTSPPIDASTDAFALDAPCSRGDATLSVGSSDGPNTSSYRALSGGDRVYLSPGPQGGQHIWISLRGKDFDPSQPLITMSAYRDDGALIGRLRVRLRFSVLPEDPSVWALPGQTLIIDDDRYCSVLDGRVRVVVELNDGAGRCLREEREVQIGGIDPAALEVDRNARLRCCTEHLPRCYPNGPPPDATAPGDASG